MIEFIVFCIPSVVYVIVQSRGQGQNVESTLQRVGATWGSPSGYRWALVLLLPILLTGWLAITVIPAEILDDPGVTVGRITSVGAAVGVVARAVGEEVFFRGLLGGVLMRRLGFGWGNLLQAAAFIVPHLALVLIDARIWPIIPVQFAAGWLFGWLRYKTGTFVPGAALHFVTNIVAGLVVG